MNPSRKHVLSTAKEFMVGEVTVSLITYDAFLMAWDDSYWIVG